MKTLNFNDVDKIDDIVIVLEHLNIVPYTFNHVWEWNLEDYGWTRCENVFALAYWVKDSTI